MWGEEDAVMASMMLVMMTLVMIKTGPVFREPLDHGVGSAEG